MKLTLSVKSYCGNVLEPSLSITVNQENASLGRRDDNTLVLHDVKKFVSNCHALVEYHSPDYFITDVSTNGTYVNDNKMLSGQEHRLRLQDGDSLMVGDYAISVMIEEDKQDGQNDAISTDLLTDDDFVQINQDTKIFADGFRSLAGMDETGKSAEIVESDDGLVNEGIADAGEHTIGSSARRADSDEPLMEQLQEAAQNVLVAAPENQEYKPGEASNDDSLRQERVESAVQQPDSGHSAVTADERPSSDNAHSVAEHQQDLIRSFLMGAGLDAENCREVIDEETFYVIGKVLRVSVEGAMEVLLGRAKIKNEMHLDMTTIRPRLNNPLKFSVNADEALRKLILSKSKEYLSPEAAITEAFDDIKAHQYSVIAGMQSALQVLMQRFDPEKLEGRLKKHSPLARKIPVLKQAKLWSLFLFLYDEIENESRDNFFRLFGQVFADAYEEQIKQLKNTKK